PRHYLVVLPHVLLPVRSDFFFFFFSSRRRHTRSKRDWSSDVCSSDLISAGECASCKIRRILHILSRSHILSIIVGFFQVLIDHRSEERRVGKECRSRRWTEQ